ncbi:unnamed protein product [Mytilus edulis]|uniref:Heat shock 70 kDa protein 12A n=1 Tax=Mytilus edulis TaxID=6550 RepID=A0A8S3TVQ3_MYTED|nr:unnamed protein product [Mytilus edulis]
MTTGEDSCNILMVVAIDIGTTYSGYAYSFKAKYEKDKLNIQTNQVWNSGLKSLLSLKTSTCILINKDTKEFDSFGFDAEDAYEDKIFENQADKYYFFDRFKMVLYNSETISKDMEITDVRGNTFPAIEVFALAIQALKQSLMEKCVKQDVKIKSNEIKWVLTVPAIWNDNAKEFMRMSAIKAGIREDRLVIALEPEVASIYCQHLPPDKITGAPDGFSVADGSNYLLVDLGGGTIDITAHHKINMDYLEELSRASGGACGERTNLKTFLLVGGFSESPLIQEIIRQNFPDMHIISPEDPILAVLKGAVLFGHKPDFITSRFTRHTYGRRIRPLFDESKHDPKKRVTGEDGDRLPLDEVVTLVYHTVDSRQKSVSVAIYCTNKDKTDYVDDEGCVKLVEFSVPIPNPSGQRRYVDVQFKFGMAKLKFQLPRDKQGKKPCITVSYKLVGYSGHLNFPNA